MIVVGVDAHSQTHTAVAVDRFTGERLAALEVRAREAGHAELLTWARELGGERVLAIEDCRPLSSGLERVLLAAGEPGAAGAAEADASETGAARPGGGAGRPGGRG